MPDSTVSGRFVDPIEKAIRSALEKGNASDRSFREKVYRSAFTALQRAMENNPNATPEVVEHRRRALSARITEIESEFVPALDPAPATVNTQTPETSSDALPGATNEAPRLDDDDRIRHRGSARSLEDDYDPIERQPRDRRGRFFSRLLLALVLIVVLAGGWWAAARLGLLGGSDGPASPEAPVARDQGQGEAAGGRDPAVSAPSTGQADDRDNWITIFDPSDPTRVAARGGASAELMEDEEGSFVRVRSGGSGEAVVFEIGQGVLERLAGNRALFNIVARTEEEQETQFSVDCTFGDLGDCGRRRFQAGHTREDFLFEVALQEGRPQTGGSLAIDTNISGEGLTLDIHAVRVSPGS